MHTSVPCRSAVFGVWVAAEQKTDIGAVGGVSRVSSQKFRILRPTFATEKIRRTAEGVNLSQSL